MPKTYSIPIEQSSPTLGCVVAMSFGSFFEGTWKRSLCCRAFGGDFRVVSAANILVRVERVQQPEVSVPDQDYFQWQFGEDSSSLAFGYLMKVSSLPSGDASIEWQYRGSRCTGTFKSSLKLATLTFDLETSSVVVSYRVLDADSRNLPSPALTL
jgi:hypothetical protein